MKNVEYARDPARVLAAEAAHSMEVFKTNEKIRAETAQQGAMKDREVAVEGVKAKNAEAADGRKHKLSLAEIAARSGEERKTNNEKELNKPITLGDTQTLLVPQRGKDGSISYVKAAEGAGKPEKGPRPASDAELSSIAINNFGERDPVSGRNVGNAATAKIAARAREWQRNNPQMSGNEAVAAARDELQKSGGLK